MKRTVLLITALLILAACQKPAHKLAVQGQSEYQIVLTTESQLGEEAGRILQDYLNQITGAKLPIVPLKSADPTHPRIVIGVDAEAAGSVDGIAFYSNGKDLHLVGGSLLMVKYAVYDFLEQHLDCRWFAPGEAYLPAHASVTLKSLNYQYQPDITTRTVHSRLFYTDSVFADQMKVTYESFPKYAPPARVHTFHRFLPEEQFYKDHPEYFALRGDRRLPTQLCLTNERVLQIVKDSVASLFNQYPQASVVSVSQDDNQQHCQCGPCSVIDKEEGSPSGTMIRFVNEVAKAFPDKTISTLAYQYTRKPSKTKPEPNVLITLCSIECDRSAPIAEKCQEFTKDLEGWSELTSNIRIWDYTTQFTNFLAPFPNLHTLQPNVQLFRENNARWIFEQHSNNPSELFELRSYLLAKLLWNPDLNVDSLITDFTNGYYHQAGPFIKNYVDQIHQELKKDSDFFLFLYGDPSQAFSSSLHPDNLRQYNQWSDEAEAAVSTNPEVLNRVRMARLGIDYATLEASRKNLTENYSLLSIADGNKSINPHVAARLEKFLNTCRANNITMMNEMRFSVQEYYNNFQAAMQVALKPNKALGKPVTSLTQPKKYANEDPLVLTDGALGGSSFYANWLGYEGNDMEVVIDLQQPSSISNISMAFLQVTNHIVFLPKEVQYWGALEEGDYRILGRIQNPAPLSKSSKVNDIQYYNLQLDSKELRFIKVIAKNTATPYWHHAAGLPSWVFADEIIID